MSKNKLSKKKAIWKFAIHADILKGPNRIEYTPSRALRFFKNRSKKYPNDESCVVMTHRPSSLTCIITRLSDLEYAIDNLVFHVGESTDDRRNQS